MDSQADLAGLSQSWSAVRGTAEGVDLAAELVRELPEGHVLADVPVTAVTVRRLRKEVVFELPNKQWAWVHLTWAKESDARWPSTTIVDSWDELVEELREAGHS